MRKLSSLILSLLLVGNVYASPTNSITIPNSFSALQVAQSGSVNDNFSEISTKFNNHSHTDITEVGSITTGDWLGSVISTQFGGTGNNFASIASGATLYFNGTGTLTTLTRPSTASGSVLYFDKSTLQPNWLAPGTNGQVLRTNGAGANPTWTDAGKVVQIVNYATGAMATGTTQIDNDNNVPANTEGDQYMVINVTPKSGSNYLKVDVIWNGSLVGSAFGWVGLFQDTNADALATSFLYPGGAEYPVAVPLTYHIKTGLVTASQTTLKIRAGCSSPGTTTFNGSASTAKYGATLCSGITVTEYTP